MDLKKEVRRRIEELTRLAYERGYRDGAQSALGEIEKVAGEDLADRLKETPASLQALAKAAAPSARRRAAIKKPKVQQRKAKSNGAAPKAVTVQRCIQRLIASKGEARRDEILRGGAGGESQDHEPGCPQWHPDADPACRDPRRSQGDEPPASFRSTDGAAVGNLRRDCTRLWSAPEHAPAGDSPGLRRTVDLRQERAGEMLIAALGMLAAHAGYHNAAWRTSD